MVKHSQKRFGWVVQALQDRDKSQADLARAWGVHDAVVTRFIATGKPDLTPERQISLARMLGMDHNELMARMYEGLAPRAAKKYGPVLPPPQTVFHPAGRDADINQTVENIRRGVRRLREMMPAAKISFSIEVETDGDEP